MISHKAVPYGFLQMMAEHTRKIACRSSNLWGDALKTAKDG